MEKINSKTQDRELAYFRFALIAPVIQGTFPDASIAAYCRRVTEKPIVRPDGTLFQYTPGTLSKWISLYKFGGMEELMPRARSDKGSTKILSDECISEIHRLKEKYPRLNAVQIHAHLVKEGLINATVSERTVQRYIKVHGLKNPADSGLL